jgi:hypothetical protein
MNDQDERTLLAGLRALKETNAQEEAPERVRSVVMAEFRSSAGRSRRAVRVWWWAGTAVAASVVIGAVFFARMPQTRPSNPVAKVQPAPRTTDPAATVPPKDEAPVLQPQRTIRASAKKPMKRFRPAPVRTAPASPEFARDFMPVISAPPLMRGEHAAVMRVELPGSSLRDFGFPLVEERRFDRVNADVVIGQDGLIRAVRFVK